MPLGDYEYFNGRAREEEKAARIASCVEARICHGKLADAYRQRCMEMLPAATNGHAMNARADQPKTRQPIVSSNMAVLAPSPLTASRPFCRA